jgi:hypothetical protein
MKTLELDQQASGQWRYRILETFEGRRWVKVDWQWGSFSEQETIQQAEGRFGSFETTVILDYI